MLTTLIYRSQLNLSCRSAELRALVERARIRNTNQNITGVLLSNGSDVMQILEGSEESVVKLFHKIRDDQRHSGVVELMRDYGPRRRFNNAGMLLFDLQVQSPKEVLQSVLDYSQLESYLTSDDRVFKFIQSFITGKHAGNSRAPADAAKWTLSREKAPFGEAVGLIADQICQFALQPIVEPSEGKISSLEALIRSNDGGSPEHFFKTLDQDKIYEVDLQTKKYAFALAEKLGIGSHKIAVNLLPMSLVNVPGAVEFLVDQISLHGLQPEQVVIEVTENEMISGFNKFNSAIKRLRGEGIGLAIDDFGSGYAGLSLLTRFQPDKIKIDREIVSNIHLSGAKQAIVRSIVSCCTDLEITLVAEGIEKLEEWCWLESAGIRRFQGFLFARPQVNGVGDIHWPHLVR
ncbi:diguanylate phosphodiesterase [Enterobacter cloacae subsp. cloacae]|uniref:diguanylate phosphodiesterase n=1 Tax=Enterobacter cloacae complex TaxID=354276 RepID=UPI000A0E2691|nr:MULTISPECIES: diguanylate phosphodiesterase [Enterobacter cloacae complex]HCM9253315.1 diguanylate phosphodiesterase [Enterobacter cloacae subsp. dissolvens]MBW4200037.1 diguanylate phosphodiesterase [Enterobacter cloacae subsp. cloacae]MCR6728392.1 diguanylate phosphodiesterase [Enterobacter cloacae]MEA5215337.1 diguanylate phosphodiesterase [Enterobacter cloacae]ORC24067.1 diguanylate phosphodiesterase [Enterobacter cloacae subsp. cloacae]